jgi:hypothetical protein
MSNLTLGGTPEADIRDAIHIAVASVIALTHLSPGDPVQVDGGYARKVAPAVAHGVVDPFRFDGVPAYSRFLVVLKPGTTKNLRHHWDHPAFPEEADEPGEYDDECRGC